MSPNQSVTRAELMTILGRLNKKLSIKNEKLSIKNEIF